MARWNDLPHREAVLNAAADWRKACFFGDGSIFTHDRIWTKENIAELSAAFADYQFGGELSFFEKLDDQISSAASHDVVQLTAEIVWLIYLFPLGVSLPGIKASVRIATKRDQVLHYLEMASQYGESGLVDGNSYLLSDEVLGGLGRSGQAYNQKRPEMFNYFLRVLSSWKALRPSEREAFGRPDAAWDFAKWLDRIPSAGGVSLRHALLHLLYPEYFERIVSSRQKRDIASSFSRIILSRNGGSRLLDQPYSGLLLQTDYTLYQIRRYLQEELGTNELDFYRSPLVEQWQQQLGPRPRPPLFDDLPEQPEPEPEPEDVEVIPQGVAGTGAVGQVTVHTAPRERMHDPAYHHADMLRRIEDLEFGLEQLDEDRQQPAAGIGHNQPPGDMRLLAEIRDEIADIRRDVEILKTRPVELPSPEDRNQVSGAAARLERKGTIWRNSLGDIFVDNFAATAGQEAGRWFVRFIVGLLFSVTSAAIAWTLSAGSIMPF